MSNLKRVTLEEAGHYHKGQLHLAILLDSLNDLTDVMIGDQRWVTAAESAMETHGFPSFLGIMIHSWRA